MKPTRRDLCVALVAVLATACAFSLAGQKPVLGSTVVDVNSVPSLPASYGSVRHFFSSPTATLENLELHVTTLNPGQQPHAPHHHPNEELILLQKGTVETLSNGKWVRVGAGSVIFNASNQLHGLRNVGSEPAVYFVVNFKTAATPAR
jgi:XRE family transcriptional regulator, regulator of sulfur utilization